MRRWARWWSPASFRTQASSCRKQGICTALRERIASFKVPRAIIFFTDEEFPVTGNEKVKTSVLRELAGKRLEGMKVAV